MIEKSVSTYLDAPVWYALCFSIAVTCVSALIVHQKRIYSYWSSRNIAGPPPLPFIGNNLNDVSKPLHLLDEWMRDKYGRLVGFYNRTTPFLLVTDVNLINEITVKKFSSFTDRRDFNEHKILVKFLSALPGDEWRRVRSFISPAFTSGKIRAMTQLMLQPIQLSCDEIKNKCRRDDTQAVTIELREYLCALTLDITVRSAFGIEVDTRSDPMVKKHSMRVLKMSRYRTFLANILPQTVKRWINFSIFPIDSIKYMMNLAESIMMKRMKHSSQESHPDFVQVMMNALKESSNGKTPLTMDEATANCLLMLIAGFETTASLLGYTIYCLAHHQQQQDKLRDELKANKQLIESMEPFNNSTGALAYLDCVINETLRMYPPVTRIERIATETVHLSNGLTLEEGTVIALPIYALHYDTSYWEKSSCFIPERFAPENKDKLTAFAFMPFGQGPRNCVGMRFALTEAKLALAKMLLEFKFTPSPLTNWPLHFTDTTYMLAAKQLHVNVQPLHASSQ